MARNRSVEGDGERMAEVVRLVELRHRRGGDLVLEIIEIRDAGDIAVAIS